ncbi:hypothetical protein ACFV5J_11010 [Streptomyces zaomyceticus]|uniref:hypothetical protein n=1 Tax=Streptomyces zaomyceticus TaxID=68286 RepID=UPI00365C2C09
MRPGDLLRIGGHLVLPGPTKDGPRLDVDALELLAPVPAWDLAEMVLDRYGPYLASSTRRPTGCRSSLRQVPGSAPPRTEGVFTNWIHAHETGSPPPSP